MKISEFLPACCATAKSAVKILLLSRTTPAPQPSSKPADYAIVLGNGPSLNDTIAHYGGLLASSPAVGINFMANSPIFNSIRPDYYVLADPHFFLRTEQENVAQLWNTLSKVDYGMTLCVPRRRVKDALRLLGPSCRGVKVVGFNFVGAEGFAWFERRAYDSRLAMPRPRNVLVPAIMTAIAAGYKKIYVAGADHSWLETLRVTDDNCVVSVQPHFYADSGKELARTAQEYRGIRLHQLLDSFRIAFRSYHTLRHYADSRGIRIFNITPGSYIDAFERATPEDIRSNNGEPARKE